MTELSEGLGLALLGSVVSALWIYGSSGEKRRANFWAWVAGRMMAIAPAARRLAWGLILGALAVGAGVIAIHSIAYIAEFLGGSGPVGRAETFNLILNSFNAGAYLIACGVCIVLVFDFPERKLDDGTLLLSSSGEDCVELLLQEVVDLEALLEQLRTTGITIQLKKAGPGRARIAVRAPTQFSQSLRVLES